MQKVLFQWAGILLFFSVLLVACNSEDDNGGGTKTPVPPLASLVAEAGVISENAEVNPGEIFRVKLRLQTGSADLRSVRILEEGVNLPTDRFTINAGAIISNNPFLITGTSKTGATFEIAIKAHEGFRVTKRYTFEVNSDDNLTDQVAINITTKGEQVSELTGKLLLNQAGPAGRGGLDLDTGNGTGTVASDPSSANAEIRDMGIDLSKPLATNWRQQIAGMNNAVIRTIGGTMPENFNYDNVKFKEEIIAAYNSGNDLTLTDATTSLKITSPLKVGDIFTVRRGDNYYLIRVTKINVTNSDNNDSYEFSIKK